MQTKKSTLFLLSFLILSLFFSACGPPRMQDLELNTDENLYAGEGEICKNQYVEVNCAEGLECIETTTVPYKIAKCFPVGYKLEDDPTYRPRENSTN